MKKLKFKNVFIYLFRHNVVFDDVKHHKNNIANHNV